MLYNEKESYETKKTNYFLGKQAGRSIPSLARLKQSALAHFRQEREKTGIPLWQHQEEITGFLLADWNTKRFSSCIGFVLQGLVSGGGSQGWLL